MLVLASSTLYREWLSKLLRSCSTVLVFLSGMKDEVLRTQSLSILRAIATKMLVDQAIAVYRIVYQVTANMSQCPSQLNAVFPIITECKYYHWSVAKVIVGTNHIIERTFHLSFRLQCIGWQFILGNKQCKVFLLHQVRDKHTFNKLKDFIWHCFAILLHLLEICSSDPFYVLYPLKPLNQLVCPCLYICPQICLIERFGARTGLAAFGAFLFHI